MQEEQPLKPLIFVYLNLRGKMQPIRNLISYLGLPFVQVHIDQEDQKKKLSEYVKANLRGLKIDKTSLPLLVYEGYQIYETSPIMNFICRRFNAEELMGRDIKQRARVNEMLDILISKESNVVGQLFRLAEQSIPKNDLEINKDKLNLYQRWISDSGYIAEVCEYLNHEDGGVTFIFGAITLIDFFFMESSHFMLGIFSSIMDQKGQIPDDLLKEVGGNRQKHDLRHFKIIAEYIYFMQNQPFYKNNKTYLESYSMVCDSFSPDRVNGLKKIWVYYPTFVQ